MLTSLAANRAKSLVGSFSLKSVFPADYIYCLVILFALIVVDRAVYILNSNVLKVVYHFCTLFGFLAYLMVRFWSEEMRLSARADLKQTGLEVFLLLKSFSFFFGCRQIRFGFPTNTLGHWLMRRRSIFNQVVYTVYKVRKLSEFSWFRVMKKLTSLAALLYSKEYSLSARTEDALRLDLQSHVSRILRLAACGGDPTQLVSDRHADHVQAEGDWLEAALVHQGFPGFPRVSGPLPPRVGSALALQQRQSRDCGASAHGRLGKFSRGNLEPLDVARVLTFADSFDL